jgi:hypothetical protein
VPLVQQLLRLADGRIAEVLPVPPRLARLYACLPHLRPARMVDGDGEIRDVDVTGALPIALPRGSR